MDGGVCSQKVKEKQEYRVHGLHYSVGRWLRAGNTNVLCHTPPWPFYLRWLVGHGLALVSAISKQIDAIVSVSSETLRALGVTAASVNTLWALEVI